MSLDKHFSSWVPEWETVLSFFLEFECLSYCVDCEAIASDCSVSATCTTSCAGRSSPREIGMARILRLNDTARIDLKTCEARVRAVIGELSILLYRIISYLSSGSPFLNPAPSPTFQSRLKLDQLPAPHLDLLSNIRLTYTSYSKLYLYSLLSLLPQRSTSLLNQCSPASPN